MKKTVRLKKPVKIKDQTFEAGKEYSVEDALADWMMDRDIAESVEEGLKEEAYEPAFEVLLKLVDGHHTVELYGDYGSGKSRFCHAVATEAQLVGKKVLYVDTEGSLGEKHVAELENYEYIGDDLETLAKRVEKAKAERNKYDLLIVDSVGLPVLNAYARWTLDKKLEAIQKLAPIMADTVRFARDGNGLSIVTNQCVSEFNRVAKKLDDEEPLGPFGGKIAFVPKLILRTEPLVRDLEKSEFRLLVWKARDLPRNYEVARFTIDSHGVRIHWNPRIVGEVPKEKPKEKPRTVEKPPEKVEKKPELEPIPKPVPVTMESVSKALGQNLSGLLYFEDTNEYIVARGRQYISPETFRGIANVLVDQLAGEYISAGKDSHFRIPKSKVEATASKPPILDEAPKIPSFDPRILVDHEGWKAEKLDDGSYAKGSLSRGWDSVDQFPESVLEVLRKGPLEIDKYVFSLDESRKLVHTRKKEEKK